MFCKVGEESRRVGIWLGVCEVLGDRKRRPVIFNSVSTLKPTPLSRISRPQVDPNYKFHIEGMSRFCQQLVRELQEIVKGYRVENLGTPLVNRPLRDWQTATTRVWNVDD